MWSQGPEIEDHPTQHVRYAVSQGGRGWSAPKILVGPSARDGFRYIARGLWVRDGRLLALASHDEAYLDGKVHFFVKSLELLLWEYHPETMDWKPLGVAFPDAINNFPPKQLPNGQWGMIRRDHSRNVSMLVGGVSSPASWETKPISSYRFADGAKPEEPDLLPLSDGRTVALFRDNAGSKRLYRAMSRDSGRTWSQPEKTNFPDATSKFFALRTSTSTWILVSNANPEGRNPLCLATSKDGIVFRQLATLDIPGTGTLQYPHAIEQDGKVWITFSRNKTAIEVFSVPLADIDRL